MLIDSDDLIFLWSKDDVKAQAEALGMKEDSINWYRIKKALEHGLSETISETIKSELEDQKLEKELALSK